MKEWVVFDKTMVLLGVASLPELEKWECLLRERNVKTHSFIEPDMNDEKTAMAICPSADPKMFRELRLLN